MSQIPFIDIAVQDAVRDAMLAGRPAIIFDQSLDMVIWANSPAARMFGYDAIGEVLIAGITPFNTTLRQLKSAAARKPRSPRSMLLRITAGMRSDIHRAQLQFISIKGAKEDVVLLTFEREGDCAQDALLRDIITGLEEDGAGAAILGEDADLIVCGPLFDKLDIPAQELSALSRAIRSEQDRLVKRLTSRGFGRTKVAVGMGRLSEEPVRNLLVAIETTIEEQAPSGAAPQLTNERNDAISKIKIIDTAPPLVENNEGEEDFLSEDAPDKSIISFEPVINQQKTSDAAFEPDFERRPVRFVWKTDIDGRFTEISDEFGAAVGSNAADIIGRTMSDVLKVFGLSATDDIEALMARRDTWSGKTVFWPVQSTSLRVPVDLAALPYYNRNRDFEGYRGFGIVRLGDYVDDPEEIGLSLRQIDEPNPDATPDNDQNPSEHEGQSDDNDAVSHSDAPHDLFGGEPSVSQSSPVTAPRDENDRAKIVPLDQHRLERRKIESLDADEAAAFKKIGETLSRNAEQSNDEIEDHLIGENDSSKMQNEDLPAQQIQPLLTAPVDTVKQQKENDVLERFQEKCEHFSGSEAGQNKELEHFRDSRKSGSALEDGDVGAEDNSSENTMPPYEEQNVPGEQDSEPEQSNQGTGGIGPEELNALPLPLLVVRDETVLYGNEAFSRITGFSDVGRLNEIGLSALFADGFESADDESVSKSSSITLITEGGNAIPTRAHLQIVPWLGQHALMFAFEPLALQAEEGAKFLQDDSSVESVSEALRSAAFDDVAEMRAILDTATDGVVVIAQDGTIRSINSAASALFGYSNEDVTGKSFSILFANESQRAAMDYLNGFSDYSVASLLNEGREVLARERNGGFLPVFMTIGKLPTSNGFCAVLRDITSWKQTEQALEIARQEAENASNIKSEFLAKVSHEIRTPLNAIIGFSELMREERFGPINNERYKEYLVDINKSGRHVLDMVNDLLDISKIEAGEQELEFEGVILNETVADAISMIQPQANRNRIIVRSSLESKLPSVVADARSIKQIVLNLLSNAIRFTQSGGQVVVSTNYTSSGSVILRIRDTGIGMTPQEIETALKPFQQVATRDREQNEGTGLGLPLTRALVQANRAEFEIASESGRGTSIEITFPPARVLAD